MSDLDVFKKLFYGMPSLPALPEFYFSLANLGLKSTSLHLPEMHSSEN